MIALSLTLTSLPFFYALPSTTFKSRASPPRIAASLSLSRRPDLRRLYRRQSIEAMSRDVRISDSPQVMELVDESDFQKLLSSENRISITGFGSLLSERSARSTFPDLENFRVAKLEGFRRVFAHAAPIFFERGIANPETKVVPETMEGKPFTNSAVLCARYSDEEFFQIRCKGNKEIYFQHYGRFNIDKIWRDDILPCRVYLRHCVLAAKNLGDEAYNNFLDHTYLGDRRTTIREYLSSTGSGIIEEEPPEALKSRYGG
ncbi:unnamed protein product [Thlaspi arvense]|uniref:Uncharacterized protein n=1 Tax=Thlaspi arvense TaxID=13288 RepID=A0AAU9T6T3_THLAR|nr:unnamed protein product [Thlaspi arvense]